MKRIIVLGGIVAALGAVPAAAQEIGVDAAFNSRYEWRGLSLTNKPVIQPGRVPQLPGGPGVDHWRRLVQRRARHV